MIGDAEKILNGIVIFLITVLAFLIFISFYEGDNKFLRETYCKLKEPKFNLTFDKKASYCFNEYWEFHCIVSYPEYCPGKPFNLEENIE